MERFRLDSVAPVVAERFRQALPITRRQAVRIACEKAVAAAGLTANEAAEALDVLQGAAVDHSLCKRLEDLAGEYDDQYFHLGEDGDATNKHLALKCFSKARAASALVFALAADDTQLHDAIYEAISATDEPGDLVRSVGLALS